MATCPRINTKEQNTEMLDKLNYCPKCGSKHFNINNEKSRVCAKCGLVFYVNPSAATAAFIVNDKGELLVTKRGKEPGKGTLDLPGGFVDNDETAEEGIAREIMEETGLEVKKTEYLFSLPNIYLYSGLDIHTLDMFFRCEVRDCSCARPADDADECFWLAPGDIHTEQFGLRSIRHAIRTYLDIHNKSLKK